MHALSDDLIAFLHGGVSILAASRDADLHPWIARGVGLVIGADRRSASVFVPDRAGASLLRVAAPGTPFAVTASHVPTLRTVQLKGVIARARPATDDERPTIERQAGGFADALTVVGFPPPVVHRLALWPATAVELRVHAVFEQTPGPGAGRPMSAP